MGGPNAVVELKIITEHVQEMFFETHDQRMNPGIEQYIRTLQPHLGRVSSRVILDVGGGGYDSTGNPQALSDMSLHLGSQDHLGLQLLDFSFDLKVIIGNECL